MSESEWPYNLPIWRRAHRASSPDAQIVAEIDAACEISMGNPTSGTLRLSTGLELECCNPSFIWSDDSRYLAASTETAYYYQPESFSAGLLVATREPFGSAKRVIWRVPEDMAGFKPVSAAWTEAAAV